MSSEKDIKSLIEACEAYLKEVGYSEARILDYRRLWADGILSYMEEFSISIYSPDIGEQFISKIAITWSASYIRALRRSVRVLSDFLSHGIVRKRIVHHVSHELSGEIGAAAKSFIAFFAELRRSKLTLGEHQRVLSYFNL